MSEKEWLQCIECDKEYKLNEVRYACDCNGLLEVQRKKLSLSTELFDGRLSSRIKEDKSGVWRFREAILDIPIEEILTHPEGGTGFYSHNKLSNFTGCTNTHFKHEGENPSGSFKDRGMTAAVTQARRLGMTKIACASTGNTSAALASYAGQAGLQACVFLPAGKVALGKLAQTSGYGATVMAVRGDFDEAMTLVKLAANDLGMYLVNSINPFRLEGQKSIIWEILQDLNWQAPDWIIVPGGNLGNTSAFGKAIHEAFENGWITKKPRLATIQAKGANPFYQSYKTGFKEQFSVNAETVATAIRIGNPVNFTKATRVINSLNGVVSEVDDTEIMIAKTLIDQVGIGCEPASACSLAGLKNLVDQGIIKREETAVCILTGHMLKDPGVIMDTNPVVHEIDPTISAVAKILQ
jgi:threonine synthase